LIRVATLAAAGQAGGIIEKINNEAANKRKGKK